MSVRYVVETNELTFRSESEGRGKKQFSINNETCS